MQGSTNSNEFNYETLSNEVIRTLGTVNKTKQCEFYRSVSSTFCSGLRRKLNFDPKDINSSVMNTTLNSWLLRGC